MLLKIHLYNRGKEPCVEGVSECDKRIAKSFFRYWNERHGRIFKETVIKRV